MTISASLSPWARGALFGVPQSLALHAEAASVSAQRVRTALTGFSTPAALERAFDEARAAQAELAAALAEMSLLLEPPTALGGLAPPPASH
ncbi:hypothetical protein V7S57_11315 [Caulobacter sp. CCNWLY153]|uniref:Uncharacterized protein n=1 Tax=Caulobacter radicis TaxID=2172650 RepID=A0A2T9IYU9_9CAUL|nr:hypothetical protein [Caulobacter radicis]PVM72373.1 hypothetical protein DDF65_22630 [Caulobacter radicis]